MKLYIYSLESRSIQLFLETICRVEVGVEESFISGGIQICSGSEVDVDVTVEVVELGLSKSMCFPGCIALLSKSGRVMP